MRERSPFPFRALSGPLSDAARAHLREDLRALLAFQERLGRFPDLRGARDGTPFVTLYAEGRLVGCQSSMEGPPAERVGRAFLRALEDPRHGGARPAERSRLTASVLYPVDPRRVRADSLESTFELGRHGLVASFDAGREAVLLPFVAAEQQVDCAGFLSLLTQKAGASPALLPKARMFAFATDGATARPAREKRRVSPSPIDAAAAYLASQVDGSGRIRFLVDARARTHHAEGPFHHGRSAIVIAALGRHGGHRRAASRARARLLTDVRAALTHGQSPAFPDDPAERAGTVALAVLASVPLVTELVALAEHPGVARNAWHAAQVVAALGPRAPRSLWEACVRDLRERPWAPWTALAADAIGDRALGARVRRTLARSVRTVHPYRGAVDVTPVPEVALTALAVEALAPFSTQGAGRAAERAVEFLLASQFVEDRIPASHDAAWSEGAFPLSPILTLQRSDVTAHALLALLAAKAAR